MTDPGTAPVRHAALVAWYGSAPGVPWMDHMLRLQRRLAAVLGEACVQRPVETLHTTLIGLDQDDPLPAGHEVDALWRSTTVDLPALCACLTERLAGAPLLLQYGGFPDRDLAVDSRGERLYERGLVISRQQLVAVGWPVESGAPTMRLDGLRRELVTVGAQHRYPLTAGATDPDAHMVICDHGDAGSARELTEKLAEVRRWLAGHSTRALIGPGDVSLVVYDDPALPVSSTLRIPLADLR